MRRVRWVRWPVSTAAGAAGILTGVTGAASTFPQNIAFCRDAFGLVTVPLEIPR